MSESFSVEQFNAYKAAVWSVFRPHMTPAVRGICVVLNSLRARVRILLYYEGESIPLSEAAQASIAAALEPLPTVHGLMPCSLEIIAERCDAPEPLLNFGCPIFGRADTEWRLPPAVEAMFKAGKLLPG